MSRRSSPRSPGTRTYRNTCFDGPAPTPSMIAADRRVHSAGIASVILRIPLDRIVAFDEVGVLGPGSGEQPFRLADPGILLQIVRQVGRLRVGAGVLVAHSLSPSRAERGEATEGSARAANRAKSAEDGDRCVRLMKP